MLGFALDMVDVWSQEQLDQLRSLPKIERRNVTEINANIHARGHGLHKQFFCNSTTHSTPQGRTGRPPLPQSPRKLVHRLVSRP